jgi:hypothetical protein
MESDHQGAQAALSGVANRRERRARSAAMMEHRMQSFYPRLRSFAINRLMGIRRDLRNRFLLSSERFVVDLKNSGWDPSGFLANRRTRRCQYAEAVIGREPALKDLCPEEGRRLVDDAERIMAHTFDLLGSGPFTPVDPHRATRAHGYRPIDWYLDPVRQLRFPVKVPHKEWRLYEMRPANADVKYPWELSRSQHLVTLAQAWRLTRRPEVVRELYDQIADFMEANPVGLGINWTCTMDVAIRAANWALAMALTLDCEIVPDHERIDAYSALFDHGKFIYANLENTHEVTSNHFLSNVVGLHLVAAEFLDLPQGRLWDEFCRKAVEREIMIQVHAEGADYESSVPYHRLVAELFLASYRLAQFQGRPLSSAYAGRLAAMIDFLIAVQRPDGLMPVIGDADDGRFHIFADYGSWVRQDARHLYAPAALALGREEWLTFAPQVGRWEATWWGFDPAACTVGGAAAHKTCKLFPGIGIAVVRTGGHYLAITNGHVGTKGFGNHKHNELLGFEYHVDGEAMLVDPGSFVYTSDFAVRNRFRSTAYHNTLMIDGIEQNETNPEWIFRLFESANPEHVAFTEDGDTVVYIGRHSGFRRASASATHERRFEYERATGVLNITDVITGEGEGEVSWHFHAAPGVSFVREQGALWLRAEKASVRMELPPGFEPTISDEGYSPSYGIVVPCQAADIRTCLRMDGKPIRFRLVPQRS